MTVTLERLKRTPLYSEELGIRLRERTEAAYFQWFLASLLFGGHISESIAANTYRTFVRYGLLNPHGILNAGWDFLVNPIMREGGYVRYDGRKSTQILRDCETLLERYGGQLTVLHETAECPRNLEERLDAFYGVGQVTVNIFLRELRPYWPMADPAPLPVVQALAETLGLDLTRLDHKTVSFTRIEAGLIRMRRQFHQLRADRNRSASA